jgi:hypothetical protein
MKSNIDYFNEITGLIFYELYTSFPVRIGIDPEIIANEMSVKISRPDPPARPDLRLSPVDGSPRFSQLDNGMDFLVLLQSSKWWLQEEGFIRGGDENGTGRIQLTTKAMLAMNATPESLDKSLGAKLGEAVKSTGSQARSAIICETVGQILGAAVNGMGF